MIDVLGWTDDEWDNLEKAAEKLRVMARERIERPTVIENPAWRTKVRLIITTITGYVTP